MTVEIALMLVTCGTGFIGIAGGACMWWRTRPPPPDDVSEIVKKAPYHLLRECRK